MIESVMMVEYLPGIFLFLLNFELEIMAKCLSCIFPQSIMKPKCLSCVFVDHCSSPEMQIFEVKYGACCKLRNKAHSNSVATILSAFAIEDITELQKDTK